MRTRPLLPNLLIVLACASCGGGSDPRELRLDEVTPGELVNTQPATVRLLGGAFLRRTTQIIGGSPGVELDAEHRVWIGDVELTEVTWVGLGELQVVVPAGLAPGEYPVRVETPYGRSGVRDPGLRIRAPLAPTLEGASFGQPQLLVVGRRFEVTVTIGNGGDLPITGATISITNVGDGSAALRGVPSSIEVPAQGSATFTVPLLATVAGTLRLEAEVTGTSGVDGSTVRSGVFVGPDAVITDEILELAEDPGGDGNPFATVASHGGRLFVGPDRTGTSVQRMLRDGSTSERVAFELSSIGAQSNTAPAAPPYTSIGAPGCSVNTLQCGPDNEQSRGMLMAGFVGGEFLAFLASRSADATRFIYYTDTTSGSVLDLLSYWITVGSTQRRGFSAHYFSNNAVFLGMSGTDGLGPILLWIASPTPVDLGAQAFPDVGADLPLAQIDAIEAMNGRVYVANRSGCARMNTADPGGPWVSCTPSDAAWTAKTGRATTKTFDFEPADKAVPAFAQFGGRLYLARNTEDGPQLWSCEPDTGPTPTCEPGEWTLVAANGSGDLQLTQFDDPANGSISLLAATASHLYVGFDNPNGVTVFRSAAAAPSSRSDFEGFEGCSAALGPSLCPGRASAGFGLGTVTRIFDARTLLIGGTSSVFFTAGDGVAPVRVFRAD